MSEPLVSLMMINRNNVQYLKQAVESVISQTYQNWELIIGDDESTDGAWELTQMLAQRDSRIKIYHNEANVGIMKNRQIAIKLCKGDYICHLDGDDMLFPYSIKMMVGELLKHPECVHAYSDKQWINEKSEPIHYHHSEGYTGNVQSEGWRHLGMFRRSAYEACVGYKSNLANSCEDTDLFAQLFNQGPMLKVDSVLYLHRWHTTNVTHKNKGCADCTTKDLCSYMQLFTKEPTKEEVAV